MGIDGLLVQLKPVLRTHHISEFEGKTVAVDAMSWLYRGCYSCAYEICKKIPTKAYLQYSYRMIDMLRRHGIKPIIIVDGRSLLAKERTQNLRNAQKQRAKETADRLMQEGDEAEARKLYSRCIKVKAEHIYSLIDLMRSMNVDYLMAPYESDGQITYLCRQNLVDYAITEDSDLLCYNCPRVIFKLGNTGECQLLDLKDLRACRQRKEKLGSTFLNDLFSLSEENFMYACILAGCDYLPSVKGMGLKTAVKFFERFVKIDSVMKRLPYEKQFMGKVPDTYEKIFMNVSMIFKHQLVFDIVQKKLRPINEDISQQDLHNLRFFIGMEIDNIEGFVKGDLDINTLEPRKRENLDADDLFNESNNGGSYSKTQNDRMNVIVARAIKETKQQTAILSGKASAQKKEPKPSSHTFDFNDIENYDINENIFAGENLGPVGSDGYKESAQKSTDGMRSANKDINDPALSAAFESQANLLAAYMRGVLKERVCQQLTHLQSLKISKITMTFLRVFLSSRRCLLPRKAQRTTS